MADLTDFIQQVKRANDIVDVIGSYLELRQSGANYFARCPFHGEKTGSFSVSRNKQLYKCFGCGESGDVIKFVEKYESVTFLEAVEILAKRVNLKMPELVTQKQDKAYEEKKKKRDVLLAICKDTAIFYYKTFNSERGQKAREYVLGRGFDKETLFAFGIGYSPDSYSLINYLRQKGYADDDMIQCGVAQRITSQRTGNQEVIDALYGRLIIPIKNMQGSVIAFGGRGLDEKTISHGKYKNTTETPLFVKNQNLFALNIVKEQKQKASLPNIVMVEGYMDVISMYQAGFRRAVASMGTSLTENQAKWLSRLTDTVYICYDGDSAGQKATIRGLDILDKAGLEVKVMSVPQSPGVKDPDEFIKKFGKEAFEKLIDEALPLPDYKLMLLEKAFPISSTDSAKRNNALPKYVYGALTMLKQLDDVRQSQYIGEVSLKTGYPREYFTRKLQEESITMDEVALTSTSNLSREQKAKYFIASAMLNNLPYATLDEKPLCDTLFLTEVFNYIFDCKQNGQAPSIDMLYTICPNATQEEYGQIVDIDFCKEQDNQNKEFFKECKSIVLVEKLTKQKDDLLAKLKQTPQDDSLVQQLAQVNEQIKKLNEVN